MASIVPIEEITLNTITMKTLRKLPFVLAFVFTLFMGACTEVAVEPVGTEDDDDPIVLGPQPPDKP